MITEQTPKDTCFSVSLQNKNCQLSKEYFDYLQALQNGFKNLFI